MRIGENPLRKSTAQATIRPLVLACVTHLPHENGYHLHRLEVIKTCLLSMRDNAGIPASISIWDNGSCQELRDWIRKEYEPDIFITSDNIGKSAARKGLLSMLPVGTIVSYSDDDIYHYPNWVQPQIKLLSHFPNVAAVTGYPVRTSFRWGNENTLKWAEANAEIKRGRFIPERWERDFCTSIGRDYTWHKSYTLTDMDIKIKYKGVEAYATAHHCQVMGYAGVLSKAAVYDGEAMGDEKIFDRNLDRIGLRLATTERLTRHMGNYIDDDLRADMVVK